MATLTINTSLKLRSTLGHLKQAGAFEPSFKLQYAADKTLRQLSPVHGNAESHVLEAFESTRDSLLEEYAETTGEGHILYEHQETGAVLAHVEEDRQWVYAEDTEDHDEGDVWGGSQRAQEEAQQLAYVFEDESALQEDLQELREETVEVDVHTVEPDVLAQVDLDRVGRQVDTSVLEVIEATPNDA